MSIKEQQAKHEIINRQESVIFTSDIKLEWFGDGEWIKEPEVVTFEYRKTECKIRRTVIKDGTRMFGGFLCGYIQIPNDHPWRALVYDEIDVSVHWGLTYGQAEEDGHWVGFDCSHLNDIVPSFPNDTQKLLDKLDSNKIFYKNIAFCEGECCSMVDQMLEANVSKKRDFVNIEI